MRQTGPWILGAEVEDAGLEAVVRSPWDGAQVALVRLASAETIERALVHAWAARGRLATSSTRARRDVLAGLAARVEAQSAALAQVIVEEAGKPLSAARLEVRRGVEVLRLAAAATTELGPGAAPVDLLPGTEGTTAQVARVPAGVVVGIVPFNFPLNLGLHKVAPALAVGAPIIVKPPPQAPSAMGLVARWAREAGADPAAVQVLPCDNAAAERLAMDPRVRIVSFTGSAKVGWHLKQACPGQVILELGGNAAAIVADDAVLDAAVARLVAGAFVYAGQVCIKVQRIYVTPGQADAFERRFVEAVRALAVGDPSDESTVIGPVIDDAAADRISAWIDEAIALGARCLLRGRRDGRLLGPSVLTDVPAHCRVAREEVFGPVVLVERVADFDAALAAANDSDYGLQAGLFTNDLRLVRRAFERLEVGGLIVNDAPTFRSDNMPYGGVKRSGLGREGVRWAMDELTVPKVLVLRP